MKYKRKLEKIISGNGSNVIVGLDPDKGKIPLIFGKYSNPILAFNRAIIEATKGECAGYKLNTAFYEAEGLEGWKALEETLKLIPENMIRICDSKRGDIGNSSEAYARAFFDKMDFDAITISPYMGSDSVEPFLRRKEKFTYILGNTSNSGAEDFQKIRVGKKYLFEIVVERFMELDRNDNIGFVFGAERTDYISKYTKAYINLPLLIPGIGAQGGDAEKLITNIHNNLFLVNSSRGIIYAADRNCTKREFYSVVKTKVKELNEILSKKNNLGIDL